MFDFKMINLKTIKKFIFFRQIHFSGHNASRESNFTEYFHT